MRRKEAVKEGEQSMWIKVGGREGIDKLRHTSVEDTTLNTAMGVSHIAPQSIF